MMHNIQVRNAEVGDVRAIVVLMEQYAREQILLRRSEDEILQHIQEFVVATRDDTLVGIAALHVYTSNLAEVRSLAVLPEFQGMSIGRLLVEACERLATRLGIAQIFALTYVDGFFYRLGYERVLKESLPYKVWTVCIHCPRFATCDEIAVQKKLTDAPIEPMQRVPIIEVSQG